ncbi:hypothetical protein JTE90_016797 [Oedothorax gibbosus]|uniref:Ig-like domain-containing protein n=1 Tax=Oedothorax gibbosus TaxID=931172 RepID=A0AAV6VZ38_9ARAC|nr:hypothetical protein JTE90_016797 [Oedothorax gibbosus]
MRVHWSPVLLAWMRGTSGVIVSNITLMTESNRTDYALQNEVASLHCNYQTAQDETVSSVRWEWKRRGSEERIEVYVWRPNRRPVAKEIFFGRTEISNSDPTVIIIRQAHMEMEGNYRCVVQTNEMQGYTDFQFYVIVDACQDNVWTTHLDMDTCTDTISMHCVGLFPKPASSCGVYNEDTRTFLTNLPFDRVLTLRNHTYEITLTNTFLIRDWTSYTNISLRCFFVIEGTSWRRGIVYKLFGDYGCDPVPPSPGPGTFNMSEEKSCWSRPREGALVHYSCNSTTSLRGPETLVCRNGSWVPELNSLSRNAKPYCNVASRLAVNLLLGLISVSVVIGSNLLSKL